MKILFTLIFSFSLLFFITIKANSYFFLASAGVTDLVLKDNLLYVATAKSTVDIFNIQTTELINTIKTPQIKDFVGDIIDSKIYSVDVLKDRILIVAQGEKGFRTIYEYKDEKLNPIITIDKKMYIAKSKYINENQIILSLLSNQLFLYDLRTEKFLWEIQVSQSKFSNFALSEDKTKIIIADESGALKQFSVKTGKLKKNLFWVKCR